MILAETSINRPVFTTMMISAILVFGIIAYNGLGIDLFPNVDFPVVTVTCEYRGASPETMETKVVEKIEEELSTLGGLEELRSVSAENIAQVYATFVLEKNVDIAAQDVRDKISAIRRNLPEAMENPVVEKLDVGAIPILTVTISGQMPPAKLSRYIKDVVKTQIQTVEGVGSIKEIGLREREIKVWINNDRLNAYHLTIAEVVAALKAKNLEVPGGKIENDRSEFVVKTMGELTDIEAFNRMTISTVNGAAVRLGDIAKVEDSIKDERIVGFLNGKTAMALQVRKQSGENTVKVAHGVKERIKELQANAPEGIKLTIPQDNSPFIEESIHSVSFDLLFGAFLTTIIILIFLRSFTSTIISAIAIPTSIIGCFVIMRALNFTLNNLSTLGLSLAVGIVIDDAIVVIENIFRHLEMGKTAFQASFDATDEIGLAVMATTFSIVAVFVPVAMMSGIVGRFLYQFGITVTVTVLLSLFVSFTLTPMLASRFLHHSVKTNFIFRFIGFFLDSLDSLYRSLLKGALRFPLIVVCIGIAVVLGTVQITKMLGVEFKPKQDMHTFDVNFQTPPGTSLTESKRVLKLVENSLIPISSETQNLFSTIAGDAFEDPTKGKVFVDLVDKRERKRTQDEIMDQVRGLVQAVPGLYKLAVEEHDDVAGSGGMSNRPVQYALLGPDFDELTNISEKLVSWMKQTPGLVDVDTSLEPGQPELRIFLSRDRMESLGVNLSQLANTVNLLVSGEQAIGQFKDRGKQYDIKVRLDKSFREYPEDVQNLWVRTNDGRNLISLSNVANVKKESGPGKINHLNRSRQITVASNIEGNMSQGEAMEKVRIEAEKLIKTGYQGKFMGFSKEMITSIKNLLFALFIAIVLIYMLLASQFEHFIHPLTIMMALPMSAIGAVSALYLTGMRISILSLIGIIMLMGLVTKNGILLVEFINQCRRKGMEKEEAILTAGPIRMRPILMTSAATIGGMIPIAISTGAGAEIRSPMAICVIGGMLTSTLLTLIVVPVVYSLVDSLIVKLGFGKK
ncbi:MAG: efflux RND transporter permease subunit [Candidatus Riflebacteria bacterium]|nr:efflux RND transporter permease subunit [Candidatus Riflebacteria bacterium]